MSISSESTTTLPPLHSFPPQWTAPESCFASTNYYRVVFVDRGKRSYSNIYGTPTPVFSGNTPLGDCFPPSYTINVPYLTDGSACPTGYTRACATAGSVTSGESAAVSTITCCPSVTGDGFSFMCKKNEYGCHATAAAGGITWTGTITDLGATRARESPVTRTPWTRESVEAWGIKLLSVASGPTATNITAPSDIASSDTDKQKTVSADASGSQDPSGGAVVGIVVGSIAGVVLLAVGAFLLYRRKKSGSPTSTSSLILQNRAPDPRTFSYQPANDQSGTVGTHASGQMGSIYQPSEMEGASPGQTGLQPRQAQQEPVELV